MQPRIVLLSAVLLLVVVCRIPAQTYTLKAKYFPSAGKSVDVIDSDKVRTSVQLMLNGQALKDDKKTEVGLKEFTEKVLEAGEKQPKKFTWTFSKATKGREGSPANQSFAGKTIVFSREGKVYKVSTDDTGVDAKDLDLFSKTVNKPDMDDVILPKKAVKVGETWPLGKELIALLGDVPEDALDVTKFKGMGKLVKAYKTGNEQRGIIEITLTVPMKKFGPLEVEKAIDLHFKQTFDGVIDGSSTAVKSNSTFTLKGRTEFSQNCMNFVLDLDINGETQRVVSAEK